MRLVDLLATHTQTSERCWFAAWDGFAGVRPDVARALTFELPDRRYFLLEGPLRALLESSTIDGDQSFNLCWPHDRSWFLATEIDFTYTYMGGSPECIADVLADPTIEALPAELTHGVTVYSDPINSMPPR